MIKTIRRKIQGWLLERGIEIRKAPAAYSPIPIFDLAVECLMAKRGKELSFVQVGANDGKYFDPLRKHVMANRWSGVLIEPQPLLFQRLKANYSQCCDRLIFENVAISHSGQLTLYLPPENFVPPRADMQPESMASNDPDVLADQLGVRASELQAVDVPAMTMDALFSKHGIERPDILQIDAEGHDWEILKTLDLAATPPTLIQIETGHLGRSDLSNLAAHLCQNGYDFHYGGWASDGLALRSDFWTEGPS